MYESNLKHKEELSPAKLIEQVNTQGYCVLPQLYDSEDLNEAKALVEEWRFKMKDSTSSNVPYLNQEQPMVYNLQNKDYFFLNLLFRHQIVEEVLKHFLNDRWYKQIPENEPNYILRSYLARSSAGPLPMHIDSFIPYRGDLAVSMQVAVLLEDATEYNGCTLIVPGSHKSGSYCSQADKEKAVPLIGKAGDLVIWDSRLWHGALENTSNGTRWFLIATFVRWWLKQAFDICQGLPEEIYEKLNDKHRTILGFCSTPYISESDGIDMKRGWDSLPEKLGNR